MSDNTQTIVIHESLTALRMSRFLLTVVTPDGKHQHRIFGQTRVRIGTHPDCDLVVDDPSVSRTHAELRVEKAGYRLVDLESKNGTRIGDLRLADVFLLNGTTFFVGSTSVKFETTSEQVDVLLSGRRKFGGMVGKSGAMREVFGLLEKISPTEVNVLLEGRPGTGKTLAAEAIHAHSLRRSGPFVEFDCSAVAPTAIDAELFGADGAPGLIEQAAGGTLFLEEVGELPNEVQARLARVLEKGELRRDNRTIRVDARIVSATSDNLLREIENDAFRSDLFYRLAVVHTVLPALRDRLEDVPLLVEHFIEDARRRTKNETLNVTYATMEKLRQHAWPGNVTELRSFIERAVAIAGDVPDSDSRFLQPGEPAVAQQASSRAAAGFVKTHEVDVSLPFKDAKARLVDAFERAYWLKLLERTDGNVSKAARIAGVHRKSVEYILRKLEIDRAEIADRDLP